MSHQLKQVKLIHVKVLHPALTINYQQTSCGPKSIKGKNRKQTKTLNSQNKTITDKKEITDTFGSFFQSNKSNKNYDKDFLILKNTTKTNSLINYSTKDQR